jgi:hypothetical protein
MGNPKWLIRRYTALWGGLSSQSYGRDGRDIAFLQAYSLRVPIQSPRNCWICAKPLASDDDTRLDEFGFPVLVQCFQKLTKDKEIAQALNWAVQIDHHHFQFPVVLVTRVKGPGSSEPEN